jgi:hypothetical protein
MKFKVFLVLLLCLLCTGLSAQSTAQEMENLLAAAEITYAQAARFTLQAAGVLEADDLREAFNYAAGQGWLPENVSPDDPARLSHISLLLMRSFNMRGGIMYSIFQNAHYAYRELRYLNVIQGRAVSSMRVSGEQFLFYINRMLAIQER